MYGIAQFDSLAVRQTQHLVVVQYCVHVLDPQGVDWPVADHPLVLIAVVVDCVADTQRHQSVAPLQCQGVNLRSRCT